MQRLLLVEDDPALQFTIQTALEANGYQVDAVVGGLTSVLSTPIVSVTTPAQGTVPPPPTGLALALGGTQSNPTVVLTWDTSAGATSYDIYRNGVLLKNVP